VTPDILYKAILIGLDVRERLERELEQAEQRNDTI
jgi:hypothetical protein